MPLHVLADNILTEANIIENMNRFNLKMLYIVLNIFIIDRRYQQKRNTSIESIK